LFIAPAFSNTNKSFYSPQHFSYKTQKFYKNNFLDEWGIACSIRAFSGFPPAFESKHGS
jgi:hypothetical protein